MGETEKQLFALYKEGNRFVLLSPHSFYKATEVDFLNKKKLFLLKEDSLDFVYQLADTNTRFVSDTHFISTYGQRLKHININLLDANKFLFIPAKYVLLTYDENTIQKLFSLQEEAKQKTKLPEDMDMFVYSEKLFSYLGSSQQMNLYVINNITELVNCCFCLFNPLFLKKRPLIKSYSLDKELNYLSKNAFYRLFYFSYLYEGFIKVKSIEFNNPYLNKMLKKESEYDFVMPFTWLRTFKKEIFNISLKNTIYIAPRIKFNIRNIKALSSFILNEKLTEIYIKFQIISYLLKESNIEFYTLNLKNYTFYSASDSECPFLTKMEIV